MTHCFGIRQPADSRWMLLWLVCILTTSIPAWAGPDDDVVPGMVLVQFKAGVEVPNGASKTGLETFDQVAATHHVYAIEKAFPFLEQVVSKRALSERAEALRRTYVVRYSTPVRPQRLAAALARDPNVVLAEPALIRRIVWEVEPDREALMRATPDDSLFGSMSHLQQLALPDAWDVVKGEQGEVIIAVVDGGTDWQHPDLLANVWTNPGEIPDNGIDDEGNGFVYDLHGWNFATDSPDPTGLSSQPNNAYHGTAVAGTALAVTNNTVGIAGSSWNARLMPINTACPTADDYVCPVENMNGIVYAAMNGADIINASWGGSATSRLERQVIEMAYEEGALVVAAAGNNGWVVDREPEYPAAYPQTLSVGATRKDNDRKASFSNYGKSVNVFAPGIDIDTTIPNEQYDTPSGTSFSTPLVAGIAALVKTRYPELTVDQLREQIRVTSDNIDAANPNFSGRLGRGRVNAFRAVTETTNPSVRLKRWSFLDSDGNLDIRSEETVQITATFINHLADVSGLTLELFSDQTFLNFTTGSVAVGSLASGDSVTVTFEFEVTSDTPSNRTLRLFTRAVAGDYSDAADVFRLPANQTAIATHNSGTLRVSITKEGNIGYQEFQGGSPGVGFVTNGVDVLFEGGLLVATGPNNVSDCVRGVLSDAASQNNDFELKDGTMMEIIRPAQFTTEWGKVEFVETPEDRNHPDMHNPIGISVLQESFVDDAPENDDFIIFRYTIINITGEIISNLYVGQFFDWNVNQSDPSMDVARYDETRQFGYIQDAALHPQILVGAKLLTSGVPVSYRAIDNPAEIHRDVAGGFTQAEKWDFLSGGIQVKTLGETDASQIISAGPFSMDPGSSVEVAFAVVAGRSEGELLQNVDNAQTLWDGRLVGVDDPVISQPVFVLKPVYPHPVVASATLEYAIALLSEVTLTIYDVLGRKVQTLEEGQKRAGTHAVVWDGTDQTGQRVGSGLYIARMTARSAATTFVQSQQIVIVR